MDNLVIIIFITWCVCGYLCVVLAESRGRNGWGGCLGGLIFGFWAIIYYLIVGDNTEMRIQKEHDFKKKLERDKETS